MPSMPTMGSVDGVIGVARRLRDLIEPVVGQVYFAPECHEAQPRLSLTFRLPSAVCQPDAGASGEDGQVVESNPPAGPRHQRRYLIMAAGLVALAVAGVLAAQHTNPSKLSAGASDPSNLPVGPAAPPIQAKGWLNSPLLAPGDLAGKVVVYDFWTYSCVNCVRTLPYVRSWYERYRQDGLIVIGVHSPEFDFEKVHGNVARAVHDLGVTWPVAFDDDMTVWNAFNNQYWPAKYITDRQGRIRYFHPGEGGYAETEDVIRTLLGLPASAARAAAPHAAASGGLQPITGETYLGLEQGTTGAKVGPATYADPGTPPPDTARLAGAWAASGQYVSATRAGAAIVLRYRAREVNLVMSPAAAGPVDVLVLLDGKPLPPAYRTAQTKVDSAGRTFVVVSAADMYRLVLGPAVDQHVLRLEAQAPGLEAFAFTFGT
jgi:thiol-disulfide isomerase/thioredoxin